ncbi:type II toxin-antitoxin system VapC family toxin [candidate division KSB1 bacterium]|nr:MAG: type II toxin-antitoxin system VapC family toxin [candidate division KSB1 bacterium]
MNTELPRRYVLDSYALLVLLHEESGANDVERMIRDAKQGKTLLWMNLINLGEVLYNVLRLRGAEFAAEMEAEIFQLPIEFVTSNWTIVRKAAFIKWRTPIAFADCFAAATAITYQAELVTGDPEFEKLDVEISICWLPRKK